MIHAAHDIALLGLVGAATATDLRSRRIPNALSLGGLVLGLTLRAAVGPPALVSGLIAATVAFAIAVPLVLVGGLGGGDAKLLAAVGAFVGLETLPIALLATALAGGAMGAIVAVRRGATRDTLVHCRRLALRLVGRADGPVRTLATPGAIAIPYGVAIAAGAVAGVMT